MTTGTALFSPQTIQFTLLGCGTGALYALVALGIVLVYRSSGVLNFAAGSLGAIAAFLFFDLRDVDHVNWIAALVIALVLGAALGVLMQVIIMRILRRASLLAKVIATLGLMAIAESAIILIWPSLVSTNAVPDGFLPTSRIKIGHTAAVPLDRLVIITIVLVLATILKLVYSKTLFGLATSAVAENRRVAVGSGWSPGRIELVNFAVAGVLSAFAAIMVAPIVSLSVATLTFMVLPALAAALVGRFSSFGTTVAAALGLGVLAALIGLFQPNIANVFGVQVQSLDGLGQIVPLLVIVGVTAARGRTRMERGESQARLPLPGSGRISVVPLVIGIGLAVYLLFGTSATWADALITTFVTGILLLSVVVVVGYAGQLSLCQLALAGFGAWVAARLVATQGWPFEFALVAGVVATVPLGLIVALPALRARGINLAVATLALASTIEALVLTNSSLTGGFGGTNVKPPSVFGVNLDPIRYPDRYGAFALIAFVLVGIVVANLRRGDAGRRLLAVRSNERAAASLGVNVYGAKLFAFGLASAIAAVAGVLLAFRQPNVQFNQFDAIGSINAVLYSVLGGIGFAAGTIVGAAMASGSIVSKVVDEFLHNVNNINSWLLLASGVFVIDILWQAPDGVAALVSRQLAPVTARLRRKRSETPTWRANRDRPPALLELQDLTVTFGGVVALDHVGFSVRARRSRRAHRPERRGQDHARRRRNRFHQTRRRTCPSRGPTHRFLVAGSKSARRCHTVVAGRRALRGDERLGEPARRGEQSFLVDVLHRSRTARNRPRNRESPRCHRGVRVVRLPRKSHVVPFARDSSTRRHRSRIAAEPAVLLLDEPAAGLDATESAELSATIVRIARNRGIGVLLIEHDVAMLLNTCDRLVVLDFGEKIAEGTPAEITTDPRVVAAYLGLETPTDSPESALQDRVARS